MMESKLKLYLFGPPRLQHAHQEVVINRRKALALLAYLTMVPGPQARDTVAALFWPEVDNAKARAALRGTLPALTGSLGQEVILSDRKTIQLNPEPALWVDALAFQRCLSVCQQHHLRPTDELCPACLAQLLEAFPLYQGDFMAGFHLPDSPDFDAWQRQQGELLRQQLAECCQRLLHHELKQEQWGPALAYARRWAEVDEYNETAHRHILTLLAACGQLTAVHHHYQQLAHTLVTDLGLAPQPDTTALYESLHGRTSASAPVATAVDTPPPHNLPVSLTPFFGRETEIKEITERLATPHCQLLTISGPGGMGKSRLAIEVGRRCLSARPHGVFFVPLAAVASPELIVTTIADALNFRFYGKESSRQQLLNYLGQKEMLLILDNFEHLLAGADIVLDILQRAPQVKLLVTSRECLNFQAEWLYEIDGLPVPPQENLPLIQDFAAIQLFTERAQRARAHFSLAEGEKSCVVHICRLVEGMPLAIELAAPLVRTHACHQIAAELTRNIALLQTTMIDVPPRHRSMQAVITQSWQQLTPEAQLLAQKLSVFRGGFTLEAAAYVADAAPPMLASLVDKSFLREVGHGRFEMHEILRQDLAGKLSEDSEIVFSTGKKCADYFSGFLCNQGRLLNGEQTLTGLIAIQNDIKNITFAWNWLLKNQRLDALDDHFENLVLYYDVVGHYEEAELLIQQSINFLQSLNHKDAKSKIQIQSLLSQFYMRLARFNNYLAKYDQALISANHSIQLAQESKNVKVQAQAHFQWAHTLLWQGQYNDALEHISTGLTQAKLLELPELIAQGYFRLGIYHWFNGDYDEAITLSKTALSLYEENPDLRENLGFKGDVYGNLGIYYRYKGVSTEAEKYYKNQLLIGQRIHDRSKEASALNSLGVFYLTQGHYGEAIEYVQKALSIHLDIGQRSGAIAAYSNLGGIYLQLGDYPKAQNHLDMGIELCNKINSPHYLGDIINSLGLLNLHSGKYTISTNNFQEALRLYRVTSFKYAEGKTLSNLGIIHSHQGSYQTADDYFNQALDIWENHRDPRGEGLTLAGLSLNFLRRFESERAQGYANKSINAAQQVGDLPLESDALLFLGHALIDLEMITQARQVYERAYGIKKDLGHPNKPLEPMAGLAFSYFLEGDYAQAQSLVYSISKHLKSGTLDGTIEPFRIFLICYEILKRVDDSLAEGTIIQAHRNLHEWAERIEDCELRQSFLTSVPVNKKITDTYKMRKLTIK